MPPVGVAGNFEPADSYRSKAAFVSNIVKSLDTMTSAVVAAMVMARKMRSMANNALQRFQVPCRYRKFQYGHNRSQWSQGYLMPRCVGVMPARNLNGATPPAAYSEVYQPSPPRGSFERREDLSAPYAVRCPKTAEHISPRGW